MKGVSGRIRPGAGLAEAAATLDADPRYLVTGRPALVGWMQDLSGQALADLRGVHFEIPDELMRLECRVAPPGGGTGAYYTGPPDDFPRPGRLRGSGPPAPEDFLTCP